MAFNQGPQPEIVLNQNGVRYVDPNPTDEIVNHEDLVMYVKLVARSKGRSILTKEDEGVQVITENTFVKSETNFTYQTGKDALDTSWTNIGGGNLNFGEDLGSFGITNINIEFKSSFMPQIVIDFVDVRGAALFEQGPCSPYAVFFHLPYPVFELTVKGYYGRPVTYTLALVKFNTKFNSETGNFESKAEFVGYTYAFLADIPMGYVMAAYYMTKPYNGKDILAKKWAQLIEKKILDESSFEDIKTPISVHDLIKKSKQLEQRTAELKDSQQVKNLTKINSTKKQLEDLRSGILDFEKALSTTVAKSKNDGVKNGVFTYTTPNNNAQEDPILTEINKVVEEHLGSGSVLGGLIGAKYTTTQSYYTTNSIQNVPIITLDIIKQNTKGFLNQSAEIEGSIKKYSINIEESFYKPIRVAEKELSKEQINKKEEVRNYLNGEVQKTLGFLPTVSNVFAIILTNVEVFLELLLLTSRDAEKYHEENQLTDTAGTKLLELRNTPSNGAQLSDSESQNQRNKVYPWPTYYVEKQPASETNPGNNTNSSEVGSKETYPGENSEYISWPEVIFVENFIKALTRLKTELEVLELEKENLPGYDNFAPITAYETHAFGNQNSPNRWYRLQQVSDGKWQDAIYRIMGENAFLIGDYTMINSLSVWKSQLGFTNGWGVETLSNYQGQGPWNSYTPASAPENAFQIGPQRLKDNPYINFYIGQNHPDLGRYINADSKTDLGHNGPGFHYVNTDVNAESFRRKIVPTTRAKMKKWGYVDALNLMNTLKLDGEQSTIFGFLKNSFTDRDTVKKQIKELLKNKITEQSFDNWKVSATQEIDGNVKLVDNQSIWKAHFSYVKTKKVLSYKGPIILNENLDEGKVEIYANPNKNSGSGAVLVKADELASRQIDFSSESLLQNIKDGYTKYYADVTEIESKPLEDKVTPATSLAYTILENRPKTAVNLENTSYSNNSLIKKDVNLIRDKNTNMLSLGTYFYPNFYHKYENNKDLSNSNIILDLVSSRRFLDINEDFNNWSSFMGAAVQNQEIGYGNPIINTPLWTVNYPLYKNSWNYADAGGGKGYIGLDELVNIKDGKFNSNPSDRYNGNISTNTKRNWSTWWGLNQWGVDNNNEYYKPLAYMAIMSLGFAHPKLEWNSGHFMPWDGDGDYHLSSFSNFTYTAIVANLPKAYVLLIGAVLWRMKETGLLRWDDINPKKNTIDLSNKGWNSYNSSEINGLGIDDLNDPVWFFHTSTSRPWNEGGSVFTKQFDIKTSSYKDGEGRYERVWYGANENGIDKWTNGGGSINSSLALNKPVYLKPTTNTSSNYYSIQNQYTGWRKTHALTTSNAQFNIKINATNGWYDMCRADQVPFLMRRADSNFERPKTLIITSLSKELNTGGGNNDTTPNLRTNFYPILKETCKELMFIPSSLKSQFITAFEEWATNDTGKWLHTLDPLNWKEDGKLDNITTLSSSAVNPDYLRNGYRGFLNYETYNPLKFNTFIGDVKSNYYLARFEYANSTALGENSITTKKNPNPTNKNQNNSSESTYDATTQPIICFVAGTKITLVDGKIKNIEDLTVEDKLLTYDLNTKTFEEGTIGDIKIEYRENLITYYFENGKKVTCTDTHPIWVVNKGWSSYRERPFDFDTNFGVKEIKVEQVKTKQIIVGDECLYYSGENFIKSKVSKIIENNKNVKRVWNIINVSKNKDFIANGILVHNT